MNELEEKDGEIKIDSEFGKELGFTSDKFDGYLWLSEKYVYVSFIISLSPSQGNLSKLFDNIQFKGYGIKVPTPFSRMKTICILKGFKETREWFSEVNDWCEVWVKEHGKVE